MKSETLIVPNNSPNPFYYLSQLNKEPTNETLAWNCPCDNITINELKPSENNNITFNDLNNVVNNKPLNSPFSSIKPINYNFQSNNLKTIDYNFSNINAKHESEQKPKKRTNKLVFKLNKLPENIEFEFADESITIKY